MEVSCTIDEHFELRSNNQDTFVGIKGDLDNKKILISFPYGYRLGTDEKSKKEDVKLLLFLLDNFQKRDASLFCGTDEGKKYFPFREYLYLIDYYFENNGKYYTETEKRFKTSNNGEIDWKRTIKNIKPIIQEDSSWAYLDFVVKDTNRFENQLINEIHKFCTTKSFEKVGFLYNTDFIPNDCSMDFKDDKDYKYLITILNKYFNNTFNDRLKLLFLAMIRILNYETNIDNNSFTFGTYDFEYIWESMVDEIFGEKNKSQYYPSSDYILKNGVTTRKQPLRPDTIMIIGKNKDGNKEKPYILDSKYYKYGITGSTKNLPSTSDVNKQITYGDFIKNNFNDKFDEPKNAFILPYNKEDNMISCSNYIDFFAQATGRWTDDKNKDKSAKIECICSITNDVAQNA